jgi:hypothetical protein
MKHVTRAGAWSNGEVAYLAWDMKAKIDDCLGFMITRVHETGEEREPDGSCRPGWRSEIRAIPTGSPKTARYGRSSPSNGVT